MNDQQLGFAIAVALMSPLIPYMLHLYVRCKRLAKSNALLANQNDYLHMELSGMVKHMGFNLTLEFEQSEFHKANKKQYQLNCEVIEKTGRY